MLIHEHIVEVRTPEGRRYRVQTHGEPRAGGAWIGWLEFRSLSHEAPAVLRTERETSQASREALESWALGLEGAYFEGAFQRAKPLESA
jgi:hypothetical protein